MADETSAAKRGNIKLDVPKLRVNVVAVGLFLVPALVCLLLAWLIRTPWPLIV
jgi:hypothetical protein